MAKYKVIALSIGGRKNKIFSAGDIVTEENFPSGNIEALVTGKYIEPILDSTDFKPEITAEKLEVATDEIPEEKKEDTGLSIDDVTEDELRTDLKSKGFKVGKHETKEDLFEKWKTLL